MKMKFFIIAIVLLLGASLFIIARARAAAPQNGRDAQGHILVEKWQEYDKAQRADRPQTEERILNEIKAEAMQRHLPWDFYDALSRVKDVVSSRNWKLRDSVSRALAADVKAFDEPVVTYIHDIQNGMAPGTVLDKVLADADRFIAAHNPEFYDRNLYINTVWWPIVEENMTCDYEYALWNMSQSYNLAAATRAVKALTPRLSYPSLAILEYKNLSKSGRDQFITRYEGKAASLLAIQDKLWDKYYALNREKTTPASEYVALRDECEKTLKFKKGFTGAEKRLADCCTRTEDLVKTLDNKEIKASIKDGTMQLVFQNVPYATVTISKGKKNVYRKKILNPIRSYYINDTVRLALPPIDDDTYAFKAVCGDVEFEAEYNKYTISIALRSDKNDIRVYAADYQTGEPVKEASVGVKREGRVIAEEKHFRFDGFTPLTQKLAAAASDKYSEFFCSYKDSKGLLHKSGEESFRGGRQTVPSTVESAVLLPDKTAFNPGETLQFKAVAYVTDHYEKLAPCKAGVKLLAKLTDPSGKQRGSLDLVTNEWGSVAGSFKLERGEKNGSWKLSLYRDSKCLASESILVDDFVLPSFEILFDEDKTLHLRGDSVRISGCVRSYSGHPLSSATLKGGASANDRRSVGDEDLADIPLADDGSFEFWCKSDPDNRSWNSYIYARVKLTDATGETWEKYNMYRINSRISPFITRDNSPEGSFVLPGKSSQGGLLTSNVVRAKADVLPKDNLDMVFSVLREGKEIYSCKALAGEYIDIPVEGPAGIYDLRLKAKAANDLGESFSDEISISMLKVASDQTSLGDAVENVFICVPGDDLAVRMGASAGRVWAVAELFDTDRTLLESRRIELPGLQGDEASLVTLSFPYKESYGDVVALHILYFRNGTYYEFDHEWRRPKESTVLPLKFTRFEDKTIPGGKYSFLIESEPGVECAATIFDKSTERIRDNHWSPVRLFGGRSVGVWYSKKCGIDCAEQSYPNVFYSVEERMGSGVKVRGMAVNSAAKAAGAAVESDAVMVEEEAIPFMTADNGDSGADAVAARDNFATTVAFEPFLRSDQFGLMRLDFTNCDKLSTFVVQLFAHDLRMRNDVLRREMVVSVPVRVTVAQPQMLYAGDRYFVKAALSSTAPKDIPGRVVVEAYDGEDWRSSEKLLSRSAALTARAGKSEAFECEIEVPQVETLGLKLTFVPDDPAEGADAMFVKIPVFEPVQTLTEAHSALLLAGADADKLIARLRSEFVNVSGKDAVVKRISILDMVNEALPDVIGTSSKDVLSTSAALYAGLLARKIDPSVRCDISALEQKVLKCRRDDGGFGWFEGMSSSPILTAVLLQRIAQMRDRGILSGVPALAAMVNDAVRYLDRAYFSDADVPVWRGSISLSQYLYVRSLFVDVPFGASNVSAKRWKAFRKDAAEYLMPTKERGLKGAILAKARRCVTLGNLSCDASGAFSDTPAASRLLKDWGISLGKTAKLRASYLADVESLIEYAVGHPHGGTYYPNAVMPWRGLMESELAAHVTLIQLMDQVAVRGAEVSGASLKAFDDAKVARCVSIAEGIRFWMMIQKETQQWGSDPAFIEAVSAVLGGSKETLATEVIALSQTYTKAFEKVKAAGNGFKVSRRYLRDGKALRDGDVLHVGDRITAEYAIWNGENRSFVRLYAPRPASLRPVNQISGYNGWWTWTQGYRNVLKDRTEYWYDSYPEENTKVTEDFYVVQKGVFRAPAVSIESLYAPHYRANGVGAVLTSE